MESLQLVRPTAELREGDTMDERVKSTDDILDSSHIVIRPGCFPTRMVLREEKRSDKTGQFITHKERLRATEYDKDKVSCGFEHAGFDHGNYFNYSPSPMYGINREDALKKAIEDFRKRTEKL